MTEELPAHTRLSASSAERFMECPGSVALADVSGAEDESEYAAEGTAAHALAEMCLEQGVDTFMLVGADLGNGYEATAEMAGYVQTYVDYCRHMAGDADTMIEKRVDDKSVHPDFGGTADFVAYRVKDGGGFVHVIDFKYGAGIPVDLQPEGQPFNVQVGYYAYGVLRHLGVKVGDNINTGMSIVQPRIARSGAEDGIQEMWVSSDDIIAWAEETLLPAMQRVDSEDTPLSPGEHCRFCPAKLICPRMQDDYEVLENAGVDPQDISDDKKLAQLYDTTHHVKMYIKAIESEVLKRAMQGRMQEHGIRLGYGRADRTFRNSIEEDGVGVGLEEAAMATFGEDAWSDPKLKSPAQIEKLPGGPEFVARFAFKPTGKPIIAGPSYRGAEYKPEDGAAAFASIDVGDKS